MEGRGVLPTKHLDIGVYGFRGIPSTYSGYETFLTVLLPELVRRGHSVSAYCRAGMVEPSADFEGVQKRFLPAVQTKQLGTLSHGALSAVVARFRRHDVVLVVNPANAIFCAFARFTGQPVVLNTDGQEWIRGKWGRLGKAFFYYSARFSGTATTALISDSRAMANLYREEFRASTSVIPYCWTALEATPGASAFERFGTRPGEYCCIAGRLVPENNAVPVARAYCASRLPGPLLVLGTANYDSPVQRELATLADADDRIRLAGHIGDRGDYAALVRGAQLYIHAHSVGGINPSLLEAMGLEARILALGTAFNREALGESGEYFEEFGSELSATLERCADDPADHVAQLRADAKARVENVYALADVAGAIEELLLAAVASGGRRHVTIPTMWAPERKQSFDEINLVALEAEAEHDDVAEDQDFARQEKRAGR